MPYAEGRIFHDADAHIMETPDWLFPFADPDIRERMTPFVVSTVHQKGQSAFDVKPYLQEHQNPEYRAQDEANIMLRKNWHATGSFIKYDRPLALDLLGFSSQLIFNTYCNNHFEEAERGDDLDLIYGYARAHNRGMIDFCSVDSRLLSSCYVPLRDFELAKQTAAEAIKMGASSLLIPSACPATHSPSHIQLDPVWAQAEEAGIPIVFHVGGGGQLLSPNYFKNGLPEVLDFHGGAENFRSVDFMAICYPPMQTLATLIFDGVLDRFPKLKWGVIEQGALWLPGWMRQMDAAQEAFLKNEDRLKKLSLRPSEFVKRQIRVTPYPYEDIHWIKEQAGEEVLLFNSDYPHVEGGRNPLKRFESFMEDFTPEEKKRFYCDNFVDLMGAALS